MAPSPVEELALLELDRSNKGASKQRRDQINAEIAIMRDLLPLPESSRQRLSQLQIMSLCCVFIRKCNTLQKMFRTSKSLPKDVPITCDFFQALTGFLLITTREGKLIYISENVTDYLGHSMVDMKTQGNSLYDIVDKRDHGTVQTQLLQGGADVDEGREVAFFCRMNMSRSLKRQAGFGDVKVMHVKGHFSAVPESEGSEEVQYVFMANCTPLITPDLKETLIQNNTMVFKTVHQLDMAFLEISQTAEHHLGFTNEEIFHKSWYSMIHPEDIHDAKEKHMQLIRSNHEIGCMLTLRMVCADCSLLWVNVVMQVRQGTGQSDDPVIVCANQIISEEEAYQFKVQSPMFHYPGNGSEMWSPMVPCSMAGQEPDNRWMPHSQTGYNSAGFSRGRVAFYSQPNVNQPVPGSMYVDPHMRPGGDPINAGGATQTETLKAILKRKIQQGPCRPSKVPRLSLQDSEDKKDNFHFDVSLEESFSRPLESFQGGMGGMAVLQHVQGWNDSVCVPVQTSYRTSIVSQKAGILVEPGWLTPPHCSPTAQSEQVVPDMSASLPESYLTPDPSPANSPASSPDPRGGLSSVSIKTERDSSSNNGGVCSMALLEQMSKMAGQVKPKVELAERATPQLPRPRPNRELPVIDPNDIDDFFENLNSPPAISRSAPAPAAAKPKPALDAGRLVCVKKEPELDVKPPVFSMRQPVVSTALQPQPVLPSSAAAVQAPMNVQPLVDEADLGDIEEFFNNVILDFDQRGNVNAMGYSPMELGPQVPTTLATAAQSCQLKSRAPSMAVCGDVGVCRSRRPTPPACSPSSQGCVSELSEEEEELLEEFSNDAIGMTLSVTVANMGQGLQGAVPSHLPPSTSQPRPEDELSQLNRLLSSLVPANCTSKFCEETQ